MSQPRYQIFVSSTFQDLEDERRAILNAILKLNQFPAGMEVFPATNDTAWELIKKVIEDSDYYVLVIGGRYGSMDESGISYTEKEYDFAVSQSIPVLAFLHSDPNSISIGKSETDSKIRKKLEAFKKKVGKHHCNFWRTTDELKEKVITSLSQSIVMTPQKGWVKAGGIDNTELLSRLADLQRRFDNLAEENNKLKESTIYFDLQQFAFGDDRIQINFTFTGSEKKWHYEISWNDLFYIVGKSAIVGCKESEIESQLSQTILQYFKETDDFVNFTNEHPPSSITGISAESERVNNYKIEKESFNIIRNQFLALELIRVSASPVTTQQHFGERTFTSTDVFQMWELTEKGKKLFLNQTAFRNLN